MASLYGRSILAYNEQILSLQTKVLETLLDALSDLGLILVALFVVNHCCEE